MIHALVSGHTETDTFSVGAVEFIGLFMGMKVGFDIRILGVFTALSFASLIWGKIYYIVIQTKKQKKDFTLSLHFFFFF